MVTDLITNQTPTVPVPHWRCLPTKRTARQININYDILKFYKHWYKIDNKFHYFKTTNSTYILINNLLNERISNHFGIKNVHIQIGCLQKRQHIYYGRLTKNFRQKEKQYQSFETLPFFQTCNLSGLKQLEELNGDVTILMNQMKKVMIRDFFTNERDRHTLTNLVLEKTDNQYQLAPLFDNDFSLVMDNDATPRETYSNCLATLDLDNPGTRRTLKEDPIYQEAIDQVFTYSLTTDIEWLQDSLHLAMKKTDIEKYHNIINQKKEILQKQLK